MVKSLQSIVDVPLQIDSTIPEVLDAALRIYNGKPIVNSVNGEEESLNTILPLVKKYGAAVVGLTLDKDGIPKKAQDRFAIAKKIVDRAAQFGIPREDVYIDCLTLTASAEQEGVVETLKAVNMVKTELGLKTVLGVSNISFGLPNRVLVNHIFLTMALENGLDLPIINPNIEEMTGAVRAFKLLKGYDKNSVDFIAQYAGKTFSKIVMDSPKASGNINTDEACNAALNNAEGIKLEGEQLKLYHAVLSGLKKEGADYTKKLLEQVDSMEVINKVLIPALDKIGDDFEKGILFLPQLIMSASVAQSAFEVIKNHMANSNAAPVSKGKIVIATVKGDVHDIGKNLVALMLKNYGFDVHDLGKDVPTEEIIRAAKETDADIIAVSALMTTTMLEMKEIVKQRDAAGLRAKIMIGGAVITQSYCDEIHADGYSKDAQEAVTVAKRLMGKD